MNTTIHTDQVVNQWRNSADVDNPAGPLFAGGRFAEAEIMNKTWPITTQGCSACTGSMTHHCC